MDSARNTARAGLWLLVLVAALFALTGRAATPAATYHSECGACHVPYPTVFLPQRSWDALLGHLDHHFGGDAEMLPEDLKAIRTYLDSHNYETSSVPRRFGHRFDNAGTPERVTETRLFRAIHGEISNRWVSGNPKVKTFSRCDACHSGAARGDFGHVRIPR